MVNLHSRCYDFPTVLAWGPWQTCGEVEKCPFGGQNIFLEHFGRQREAAMMRTMGVNKTLLGSEDHVRGSASTSPGQGMGYGTENTADSSSPFKENHERKLPSHSINLIIVRGYKTLLTAGHFPCSQALLVKDSPVCMARHCSKPKRKGKKETVHRPQRVRTSQMIEL